jgi:translation initiation factor eIF-2B subunit alpha
MAAKEFNKPMYVTAESYKFVRAYPLNQRDIPSGAQRFVDLNPANAEVPCPGHFVNPLNDYTPPKFIRLLITDLGVLTPSVVSDELIKLYN